MKVAILEILLSVSAHKTSTKHTACVHAASLILSLYFFERKAQKDAEPGASKEGAPRIPVSVISRSSNRSSEVSLTFLVHYITPKVPPATHSVMRED